MAEYVVVVHGNAKDRGITLYNPASKQVIDVEAGTSNEDKRYPEEPATANYSVPYELGPAGTVWLITVEISGHGSRIAAVVDTATRREVKARIRVVAPNRTRTEEFAL